MCASECVGADWCCVQLSSPKAMQSSKWDKLKGRSHSIRKGGAHGGGGTTRRGPPPLKSYDSFNSLAGAMRERERSKQLSLSEAAVPSAAGPVAAVPSGARPHSSRWSRGTSRWQSSIRGSNWDYSTPMITQIVHALLGTSPYRSVWGVIPCDLGALLGIKPVESRRLFGLYEAPRQRHEFNQKQGALHAEWSDLFLDLIFVGAGYRLGVLIKAAFYSCSVAGGGGGSGSDSGAGSGSGSTGGRALAAAMGSAEEPECVGLGLGILYFCAIFQVMYRSWLTDMLHTARYDSDDTYHRVLDVAAYFLLCLSANSIKG